MTKDIQDRPPFNRFLVSSLDLWRMRLKSLRQSNTNQKAAILKLEKKTEQLMDRLIKADSKTLITAYENQIKKLEGQKVALTEKSTQNGAPLKSFEDSFRTAITFLAKPWKL